MSRKLIDRDALIASIPKTNVDIFENCRNCSTLCDWQVRELIEQAELVDAVEVVRCKDCKYWDKVDKIDGVNYGTCERKCTAIRQDAFPNENWFCADGEKA